MIDYFHVSLNSTPVTFTYNTNKMIFCTKKLGNYDDFNESRFNMMFKNIGKLDDTYNGYC